MANSEDYIEYAMARLEPMGLVQYKKMFGEGMLYIDGKPILLVCGNSCYVKKWPELVAILGDYQSGIPYAGSSEQYIVDLEDKDIYEWLKIAWSKQAYPKKRNKKSSD